MDSVTKGPKPARVGGRGSGVGGPGSGVGGPGVVVRGPGVRGLGSGVRGSGGSGGPGGRAAGLEVGAQRAPRLLVKDIHKISGEESKDDHQMNKNVLVEI